MTAISMEQSHPLLGLAPRTALVEAVNRVQCSWSGITGSQFEEMQAAPRTIARSRGG